MPATPWAGRWRNSCCKYSKSVQGNLIYIFLAGGDVGKLGRLGQVIAEQIEHHCLLANQLERWDLAFDLHAEPMLPDPAAKQARSRAWAVARLVAM